MLCLTSAFHHAPSRRHCARLYRPASLPRTWASAHAAFAESLDVRCSWRSCDVYFARSSAAFWLVLRPDATGGCSMPAAAAAIVAESDRGPAVAPEPCHRAERPSARLCSHGTAG